TFMQRVHGEALQPSNLNRLFVIAVHHAGTFTQHLHRAGARTAGAQNIRIQNRLCRTHQIAAGDLLDELWHIDMRGTGLHTWRIETVEAAVRLWHSRLFIEGRMQIWKTCRYLRRRLRLLLKTGCFTHRSPSFLCPSPSRLRNARPASDDKSMRAFERLQRRF